MQQYCPFQLCKRKISILNNGALSGSHSQLGSGALASIFIILINLVTQVQIVKIISVKVFKVISVIFPTSVLLAETFEFFERGVVNIVNRFWSVSFVDFLFRFEVFVSFLALLLLLASRRQLCGGKYNTVNPPCTTPRCTTLNYTRDLNTEYLFATTR